MALVRTSLVIPFAAALVGVAGCADTGGQTLVVLSNSVPGDGCVITPMEGGVFIPSGRIDALGATAYGSTIGYVIAPTIKNLADSQDGTLENQRTVLLQGARVDLVVGTHADGSPILDDATVAQLTALNALKFTAPFSGPVSPDGGLVGVAFEVVPRAVVEAIGAALGEGETALVTASFTVFGRTISGSGVEADAYTYPITVCNGCLFTDLGSCIGLPQQDYPAGGECNMFQDESSTCCTSGDPAVLVCPAVAEAAPV